MSVRLAGGGAEITPLVVLAVDSALGAGLGAQTGRLQLLAPLAWGLGGRETAALQAFSPGQPFKHRASKHVGASSRRAPKIPVGAGHGASKQQSNGWDPCRSKFIDQWRGPMTWTTR